jgi:hypothetical protein
MRVLPWHTLLRATARAGPTAGGDQTLPPSNEPAVPDLLLDTHSWHPAGTGTDAGHAAEK